MIETAAAPAKTGATEAATLVRQIAHELRQPLSTIESIAYYLDLILPRDESRARAQLERLQHLVDQSNWIVSNAVHYLQTTPPAPQFLDLDELLNQAAAECPAQPRMEVNLEHVPFLVRLDHAQAVHMFANLLDFLRRLSNVEPIRVTAARSAAVLEISFFVAALGRSAAEMEGLFQPFPPAQPAGGGLSLASVRRIAEAHRGRVSVSADPECGVTVILTLPV